MARGMERHAGTVAAFDLGSNTARGILAERCEDGPLKVIVTAQCMTALGRALSISGHLDPEGLALTARFLRHTLDEWQRPRQVFIVATAAARDARNGDVLLTTVRREAGVEAEIIGGEEEGRLSYLGALALTSEPGLRDPAVVDIGGRSTEVVIARGDGLRATSLPIGARSLTEMFLRSNPPTPEEMAGAERAASDILSTVVPTVGEHRAVAVGGTAQAAARLSGDGKVRTAREIEELLLRLSRVPLNMRSAMMPFDPERAEIICGGLITLHLIARVALRREVLISEGGVREGLLLDRTGATGLEW